MKNVGTLVGAPVRINDDQDLYAAAFQSEIKGGHHNRTFETELATFPTHLRVVGMTCYIAENKKTYQLDNDLVTWNVFVTATPADGSGGTTNPGTGGNDNTTATIISGNFGAWTPLLTQSANIFDKQIELQYKADLTAFPSRSTVFITGQFGLKSDFDNTEITLGVLPTAARPKAKLKKWMACKGVELYLVVETNGAVKLTSKDGFKLPVTSGGSENDPYFIDVFFNPDIAVVVPTVYTYTHTQTFTRDNCGAGNAGSDVPFSKDYTSNVSLADAQNIAMADSNFLNLGQANANANGTCEVEELDNVAVSIGVTAPNQTGAYNVFGFKIVSQKALQEYITISFRATYEAYNNVYADYEDTITLPPNNTEFDPGSYPVMASPAANEPNITILSVTPENGGEVTDAETGEKYTLAAY